MCSSVILNLIVLTLSANVHGGDAVKEDAEPILSILHKHNPKLIWSAQLERLSRQQAVCEAVGEHKELPRLKLTPQGEIGGFVDGTLQEGHHINTHNERKLINDLLQEDIFKTLVMDAEEVGCEINAGCESYKVIACHFQIKSQELDEDIQHNEAEVAESNIPVDTKLDTSQAESKGLDDMTGYQDDSWRNHNDAGYSNSRHGDTRYQYASSRGHEDQGYRAQQPRTRLGKVRSFTEDQRRTAEGVIRILWDRTHFLENLSGAEADCAMVEQSNWPWTTATKHAKARGINVQGVTGTAPNDGDTGAAIRLILEDMRDNVVSKMNPQAVGCSVIPGCRIPAPRTSEPLEEDVLVVCIFRLQPSPQPRQPRQPQSQPQPQPGLLAQPQPRAAAREAQTPPPDKKYSKPKPFSFFGTDN